MCIFCTQNKLILIAETLTPSFPFIYFRVFFVGITDNPTIAMLIDTFLRHFAHLSLSDRQTYKIEQFRKYNFNIAGIFCIENAWYLSNNSDTIAKLLTHSESLKSSSNTIIQLNYLFSLI